MKKLLIAFIGALSLSATVAFAQSDNIGHTRHLVRHNNPHPRAVDETRFHTVREGAPLELPTEEGAFVFGVFGDRTGGPEEGVAVLADAVHDINLFEPDLVMTVGDLVQGYNTTPLWLVQMEEYKSIMDQLLCPWFPVVGNHDIYWRGPDKPKGEHEQDYETHFGPLWYAFKHKNCWFVALYSDEGNPETGEKSIRDPAAQRMSDAQFNWLRGILEKASDADHVFLFLHHPRWIGGNYGDDWERVHRLLVDAGNVTAVFAGHIHRMRSDPRDGIEYITLATVGGGQGGHAPKAGWLHQYHLVTVRKNQIAVAAVPVGEVLDPRAITGQVSADAEALARADLRFPKPLVFAEDHSMDDVVTVSFRNPTTSEIEVTMVPESADSRWFFSPDHLHKVIPPNGTMRAEITVRREAGKLDDTYRPPAVALSIDYLAGGLRYPIPRRRTTMDIDIGSMRLEPSQQDMVLDLDGDGDVLRMPTGRFVLPDGPMTLEAWFEADSYAGRRALVAKTQNSEYGIFVSEGRPVFSIFLGEAYVEGRGADGDLQPGQLYHIAGVYDGAEVRLYVNGRLIEATRGSGPRKTNDLDLLIGGDIDGDNRATSTLDGRIHSVRLSRTARYSGKSFSPEATLPTDESIVFATTMDIHLRNWVINEADNSTYATLEGDARLVPLSTE